MSTEHESPSEDQRTLDLIRLVHSSFPDAEDRTAAVTATIIGLWQFSLRNSHSPGLLLVNPHATAPDPVEQLAGRFSLPDDPEPPTEGPGQSRFSYGLASSRRFMLHLIAQAEQITDRDRLAQLLMQIEPEWAGAKSAVFGSGLAGLYAHMWDDYMGWITNAKGEIVLYLKREEDHARFREDLLRHPERIVEPTGYGPELKRVPKSVLIAGSLSPAQFDDELVSGIIQGAHPILFVPHTASQPTSLAESYLVMQLRIEFFGRWIGQNLIEDSHRLSAREAVARYNSIIVPRLRHMPDGYEFFVRRAIREVAQVCKRVAIFASEKGMPLADARLLWRDLYETTLRGITAGVVSLAYHGWGFHTECPRPVLVKALKAIRSKGEISRRDLQRELQQKLNAAGRDRLLASLETEGLVRLSGSVVAAVGVAEFIKAIPTRAEFPRVVLETAAIATAFEASGRLQYEHRNMRDIVRGMVRAAGPDFPYLDHDGSTDDV